MLLSRDVRDLGPEGGRGVKIQSLVEIEVKSKARLVDVEEPPQPRQEEGHNFRAGVCEPHGSVAFRSLARVQRRSRDEEGLVAQNPDAGDALLIQRLDLAQLGDVLGMGTALASS